VLALAACSKAPAGPAPNAVPVTVPAPTLASAPQPAAPVPRPSREPPSLKQDPAAGERSTAQWREHLEEEEEERQLAFDRFRLKLHRDLVKRIAAARARLDQARTEAALEKARAELPERVSDIQKRVVEIDHWRVNTPLLADYDAIATALSSPYADAKLAALKGDATALNQAREAFDKHMKRIDHWLHEVEESGKEGYEEREREERAREERREREREEHEARR
jgi:hypothetical protein